MTPRQLALLLVLFLFPVSAPAATLEEEVEAFLRIPAVVGREEPAAELLQGRLAGLPVRRDALGNLLVTVGSGSPRRLVACPMGEPGYVVSRILDNGYLRLMPASGVPMGALWDQSHWGQTVVIGGARGWVPGAVVLPSVHLMQGRSRAPEKPVAVDDFWVDVGAESAAEVEESGIRLLDAVALVRRPSRLGNGLIAAPYSRVKGGCIAAVEAARRLHASPGTGTTVFAWTTLDLLNRKGLEHLSRKLEPFDEVVLISPGFGWKLEKDDFTLEPLPKGLLGAGDLPRGLKTRTAPHLDPGVAFNTQPDWGKARVGHLGLSAVYPHTPVEAIFPSDVEKLADALSGGLPASSPPPLPPPPALFERTGYDEGAGLLSTLIDRYGVSGAEGPVREEILKHLPDWAKPETDAKGNLWVTVGQGEEHVLFVAHMDEVGFRVKEILPDGRLSLEPRGGLLVPAWEAHAALVHGEKGAVPGVFEPREGWVGAKTYRGEAPLTVYVGSSPQDLGIKAGETTVTMPKKMYRIGRHRALARGFDDRIGCTAQLLALRRIDPAKLRRRVTFAWVVEEEVGLIGSADLARRFPELDRVHPVDTFVSSDSPIETGRLGWAPLGKGAVLRTMDNLNQTPRELIDRFLDLADRHGIPVQYGMTGGSSDGLAFTGISDSGPEMLPFSWPGRHSHSPVEVADLRDVESLVRLVIAAATH